MPSVQLTKSAQKDFKKLSTETKARISAALGELQSYPAVTNVKALEGMKGVLRMRVGDYRIFFKLEDGEVHVVKIGDRKEVYRQRDASFRLPPIPETRSDGTVEAISFTRRSIGQDLKAARLSAGLTQAELATEVGCAQATVSMSEAGKIGVGPSYVRDVLKACGIRGRWPRS